MHSSSSIRLIYSGILIPVVFWSATVIAGLMQGDYSHLRDTISDLGAIGTRSESLMAGAAWACALLGGVFLMSLYTACRQLKLKVWPLIGIVGYILMFGWAALYPSGHEMHSRSGPILLLLIAGPVLSMIYWKGRHLESIRTYSLMSVILMLCVLLMVVVPESIRADYIGLIQRLVHLGWTVWFIGLTLTFARSPATSRAQRG